MAPARFEYHALQHSTFEDSLLVVGHPTPGLVALVASRYLVETLKLPLVGLIQTDALPPVVVLDEGRPSPPIRVHLGAHVCTLDQKCDQLGVLEIGLNLPPELHRDFARAALAWGRQAGVGTFVILEALPRDDDETTTIRGAGSTESMVDLLQKHDVPPISGVQVSGLTAAFLDAGAAGGHRVLALFVEAAADLRDPGAAAALIETVDKLVPRIALDAAPLREHAKALAEQLHQRALRDQTHQEFSNMYR